MADPVASLSSRLSELNPAKDAPSTSAAPTVPAASAAEPAKEAPEASADVDGAPVDEDAGPQASSLLESLSHEVQVTLADQQLDPNSPLFSAKSFEDLNLSPELLKGIYKMGFQKPSKIQEKALPLLLSTPARNMIGQSQSGTGKTAAFALTMLSRVDANLKAPQALCIAPSRELAQQNFAVVQKMGEYTNVECFFAGKESVSKGMPKVQAQIIIGTPGTMIDMATRLRVLDLKNIKVFVLDEADNMLEQGSMSEQSINIKNMVTRASPDVQLVLFSATFADKVHAFAAKFAPQANEIKLKKEELSLDAIKQFFMDCDGEKEKYDVLVELYNILTIGQSIIFVQKRETADEISRRMTAEGHKVVSLHGGLQPTERDQVMESFRDGKTKVLISTNVISRGIDVMQVNMVVNYDLPLTQDRRPDVETYIHRIGRTGRFGRQGISINFVHDKKSFDDMTVIEKALGRTVVRVDTKDLDMMEETLKAALKS